MHACIFLYVQVYESPINRSPWHVCLWKAGLFSGLSATTVSSTEALYRRFIDSFI